MTLLRRRGIAAARQEGAPPPGPAYFQTDHFIWIAPAVLTDQPGYFQTDQNIQE